MPESLTPVASNSPPDYEALIRFLILPFLESPEALKLDCEISSTRPRIWVRLAFEGADKGRVFGRGGRNIQAVRTVLEAVAKLSGHSVHLDVYGTPVSATGDGEEEGERPSPRRPPTRRNSSRSSR